MKDMIMIEHVALESAAEHSHDKLREMWVQLKKDIDDGHHIRIITKSPRIIGHGFKDLYDITTLNLFITKFEDDYSSIIGTKTK
ncbi:hypothetical protein [Aquirufa nivalisilvae]|uniref:hypothetical protein n=1 Tax=Aquirufa nivalisilvae TaxID=2516557 RepID=UPI0022A9E5EA|nr:hypothetical protein [Aquirufa nivalisilvae]MCZ2480026.1 hypothetical protein [Aquirufa nivalisilvae]